MEVVKAILEAALQGPVPEAQNGGAADAEAQRAAAAAQVHEAVAAEVARGARAARPSELVEVHSGSTGGHGAQRDGGAAAAPAGAVPCAHQWERGSQGEVCKPETGGSRRALDRAASATGEALPAAEALAAAAAGSGGSGCSGCSGCSGIEPVASHAGSGGGSRRAAPVTKVPEVRTWGCVGFCIASWQGCACPEMVGVARARWPGVAGCQLPPSASPQAPAPPSLSVP